MRIIGWMGTIVFFPFYLLFCIAEKARIEKWLPILYDLFILYVIYDAYRLYKSGTETTGQFIGEVIIVTIGLVIGYVGIYYLNIIICVVLIYILYAGSSVYQRCIAWKDQISMDELQGRLDYIRYKKTVMENEKKRKKEEASWEAHERGFRAQQEKDKGGGFSYDAYGQYQKQYGKEQEDAWKTEAEIRREEEQEKQRAYEEWYCKQRTQRRQQECQKRQSRYEQESQREQQAHQQYQERQNKTHRKTHEEEIAEALELLMVEKEDSLEKIKENFRTLSNMAHPDLKKGEEAKEKANEFQGRLNDAYRLLKNEYKAETGAMGRRN